MKKQLPAFTGSVVLLSACSGNSSLIGLSDKVLDKTIVDYCKSTLQCEGKILDEVDLFYCVDTIRDEQYHAKTLGCEAEHTDLFECEVKEARGLECRSDFDNYDDWQKHLEDLAEEYYADPDPCEKDRTDLEDCINDFMGTNNGGSGYYQY